MNVVVTGATGFIGSALVRALLQRGDRVTALSRSVTSAARALPPEVDVLVWSPPALGPWAAAVNGADAVINLAGETVASPTKPWTDAEKQRIRGSRIDATSAIVSAVEGAERKPAVLINASAIGYYGSQGDRELTESAPAGSDFLASVCVEWEAVARRAEAWGVRVVLPRTAVVLGTRGALPQLAMPFKFFLGGTMGDPHQWVSWIHIDDEIGLLLFALDHADVQGPMNLSAPNPVTMDRFSREIGSALGRPTWVPFLGTAMRVGLGERASVLLASQRVLPSVAEKYGYRFQYPDSAEALRSILE